MEPLHHPVRLRMIGAGADPSCPQETRNFCPESGLELGASVRRDELRYPETGDPAADEVSCDCGGVHRRQWYRLRPAGEAIDDRQQVRVAAGWRQWADQIDVDVLEPSARGLEAAHGRLGVAVNLRALTVLAGADEVPYVGADPGPDEPRSQEMPGGGDTWVREVVEGLHDGRT